MPDRLALITGATGAVGPQVVAACQSAGYAVRTLARNPSAGLWPSNVDARVGDIGDADTVRCAAEGADVVIHLAALLHQCEPHTSLERDFERVNVGGTENLVCAAVASGVKRFVYVSTIAVYGPSGGAVIDERTEPRPDTPYARTKLAAERVVLDATRSGQPLGTVLRAAAVYGPRVKGNYRRLALAIARRRYMPVGRGTNRRTLVHDRDLAAAIVAAAAHPQAAGQMFNVSDGRVHTLADIVAAICRAAGRQPPRWHVPLGPVRAAASAVQAMSRMVGRRPPISRAMLDKYTEDIAVDATMIQRMLGLAPTVDLAAGWRETLSALRETGQW